MRISAAKLGLFSAFFLSGFFYLTHARNFVEIEKNSKPTFLSKLENDVFKELNLARRDPKAYASLIEKTLQYYDGKLYKYPGKITIRTNEGPKAVKEAVKVLKKTKSYKEFSISKGLSLAGKDHVKDQSESGKVGHTGKDGSSPFDRMKRYGKYLRTAGENISYGENTGRSVVFQLIIDDGVPGRGHRKNIYNENFKTVGIACGTHKKYRHMCVITFAGGFQEKK